MQYVLNKFFILALLALFALQPSIDSDLGWHLRYGEYFWQTGHILRENIISYTWPEYSWVHTSWGYDIFIYPLFNTFGFIGLSILASLLIVFTFVITAGAWKKNVPPGLLFILVILFLILTQPLYAIGMRTQIPAALCFAALLVLLDNDLRKKTNTVLIGLPLLFLLWTNLHGSFFVGLLVGWAIWFLKRTPSVGFALALSTGVTLLNPWGARIYQDIINHSTSPNLSLLSEWRSIAVDPVMTIFLVGMVFILIFASLHTHRTDNRPYQLALLLLLFFGFQAMIFIVYFGILAIFFLARDTSWYTKQPQRMRRFFLCTMILFILGDVLITKRLFFFSLPDVLKSSWNTYCNTQHICSEPITQIMRTQTPEGLGYHPYTYGGYLSWRVPNVKTFVDGRMAAWQKENGSTPPIGGNPALFITQDARYHFDWIIVPTSSPITSYIKARSQSGVWSVLYNDDQFFYAVRTK